MTNAQRAGAVALFVVAVLGGALLASFALGIVGGSGSPSPGPSGAAATSPSPGTPSPVASPSASVEPSASASPSPVTTPSAAPTPTTVLTPGPGEPATITFTSLRLDAAEDPDGRDRELSFQSQGTGPVKASLTLLSPQGTATMCLRTPEKELGCTSGGSLNAQTTKPFEDFTLALRGEGIFQPVVEVTLTFPATGPSVRLANARFDGTAFPDTNGIEAILAPRADGDVHVVAEWGGHPLLYEIDLLEQGGPGVHALTDQGPATGTDTTLAVVGPNPWKLVLANAEDGFGTTPMTVEISWP